MGWDRRAATAVPIVERVVCLSFEVSVYLFPLMEDAVDWIRAGLGGSTYGGEFAVPAVVDGGFAGGEVEAVET